MSKLNNSDISKIKIMQAIKHENSHQILHEKPPNLEWKNMGQIQIIHFNKIKITTLKIMVTTLVLNKSGKISEV